MKLRIALLSFALLIAFCSGCATYDKHPAGNHISINMDGQPHGYVGDTFKELLNQDELRTTYIDPIIDGIEKHVINHRKNSRNPAKVLLFIHGGLNEYNDGIKHVKNIKDSQNPKTNPDLAEQYLVSLNWEAGLRSALFDHFFKVRAGERNWPLATATFPFVFAGDVGQSVINMPRDIYYAYIRDLALTQGPQLAKTGLVVGAVAAFYGGIVASATNLLFKDIILQSVIVAGGVYGAPVFFSNPFYYAFGPIRMLSAPFIDGFGTPAWEMLKRRTDFVLHNPEIFAKTSEKGAGYILLKQLAEKTKKAGYWKTEDKELIPVQLTLAGHSMGAMLVDRILATFNDELVFNDIIYMGAASSLADFQLYAIPYLREHPQSRLWSFSLSDLDETNETYGFDLIMRGSLLVWIEKFFEPQHNILQRRFGREISQDYVNIDDEKTWKQTCRITLQQNPIEEGEPLTHGDFTNPKVIEQALSIVNHRSCPQPVDITSVTKEELRHIPEFKKRWIDKFYPHLRGGSFVDDHKWVDDIIAKKPYDEKEDLVDRQIISDFRYRCIKDFFLPVNINSATLEQLARLLRGDRLLANKILNRREPDLYTMKLFKEKKLYKKKEDLHDATIIPDFVYEQIKSKIIAIEDPIPTECQAGQDIVDRLYFSTFSLSSPRYFIHENTEAYRKAIISEVGKSPMSKEIAQSDKDEGPGTMEKSWSAIFEIGSQRVGLDIHISAELGESGSLRNWWTSPNVVDEHSKSLAARAKTDGISMVFLVWNKDVFKWPGMNDMMNSLKQKLGQTKLVPLYGSPQDVARVF